jgi:AraC family transcriptional regulator
MNSAVERAIACMWERYHEPIGLVDIAESAILSRFHFARTFKDSTGVSPGRYLSAVRIYQAKRMLVTTSMRVTDISFAVGFNSLGSFTNHFTDSVGLSPSRFRSLSRDKGFMPPDQRKFSIQENQVTGTVTLPSGYASARVYVGAFASPIVERRPVSSVVTDVTDAGEPIGYRLPGIPEGTWFIHAVAIADSIDPEPWTRRALLVSGLRPVTMAMGGRIRADISLRPRRPTDLPILLALPDLEPESDGIARTPAGTVSSVRSALTPSRRRDSLGAGVSPVNPGK